MDSFDDVEINVDKPNESIKNIVIKFNPSWSSLSENIKISCLSGGITNKLFACYLEEKGFNSNKTVLFRVYGERTEQFISRSDEIEAMNLVHEYQLGPRFYGKFKNGIFYEFLPGSIYDEKQYLVKNVYSNVAKAIAHLHMIRFDGFITEKTMGNKKIFIFPELITLINLVKSDYRANIPKMTDELLKSIPSKIQLEKEIEFLTNYLKDYAQKHESLVVYSHNDLLMGNIICNENAIKFIDFEYGAYNYQAYDIANHFNEYAGVEITDYSLFPSKEYQLDWLAIYLEEFYAKANDFYKNNKEKQIVLDEARLLQFYDEVNKFTLASHLMWGIWSLVQAQSSSLEFDFVKYAHIRLNEYFLRKTQLIQI